LLVHPGTSRRRYRVRVRSGLGDFLPAGDFFGIGLQLDPVFICIRRWFAFKVLSL